MVHRRRCKVLFRVNYALPPSFPSPSPSQFLMLCSPFESFKQAVTSCLNQSAVQGALFWNVSLCYERPMLQSAEKPLWQRIERKEENRQTIKVRSLGRQQLISCQNIFKKTNFTLMFIFYVSYGHFCKLLQTLCCNFRPPCAIRETNDFSLPPPPPPPPITFKPASIGAG